MPFDEGAAKKTDSLQLYFSLDLDGKFRKISGGSWQESKPASNVSHAGLS